MSVKVKVGHPMLEARRVMKKWPERFRAGWIQLCGNAMAHYYDRADPRPMCGTLVDKKSEPQRGVSVPACKLCVKARGGKL